MGLESSRSSCTVPPVFLTGPPENSTYRCSAASARISVSYTHLAKPPETSPVTTPEQVAASRDLVNQIYIDDAVLGYIVDLVRATRFPETVDVKLRGLIRAGASPRATINLALAARANAFMHHRSFVTPQDLKDLAHDLSLIHI